MTNFPLQWIYSGELGSNQLFGIEPVDQLKRPLARIVHHSGEGFAFDTVDHGVFGSGAACED